MQTRERVKFVNVGQNVVLTSALDSAEFSAFIFWGVNTDRVGWASLYLVGDYHGVKTMGVLWTMAVVFSVIVLQTLVFSRVSTSRGFGFEIDWNHSVVVFFFFTRENRR